MLVGLDVSFWLISIAAVLLLLVLVVLWFRRLPENVQAGGVSNLAVEIPSSTNLTEAIVTIQPGGRVDYLNNLARDWFGLRADELPEIEKLIRKARPAEDFLNLCAAHGQKRLSVGGRLVEATSYQVPGPYPLMFITMRSVSLAASVDTALSDSSMLKIISDFGRGVTESLDLDNTIYSILLNVSHLVPADVMEIKIWDLPRKTFDTYTLDPSGASKIIRAYTSQFGALTDTLVARRAPILIPDIRSANPEMAQLGEKSPVLSYIGLPLLANNELIGVLEFGHLSAGTLGQHDLDLLQLVSSQAGFGIHNARTYANEVRRSKELSGLVNLTQSVGVTQDYSSLLNRLIDSISPLFAVDILGFLLYDANKRTLEGQVPFQGLPRHIVEIYRTTIMPESPAEKVIQEGRLISARNAADDRTWSELGLQTIAQAASLRESVLAPMIAGEQFVGFVQISNHKQASVEFSESELRLIETVASQAAGIIHNSFLVERTRQRAIRSDGLRRIANLSTSTAGLDEIVQLSVDELARLLRCDLVALFLEDQKSGGLQLHENSVFGVSTEAKSPLLRLHAEGVPYRATVAGTRQSISTGR